MRRVCESADVARARKQMCKALLALELAVAKLDEPKRILAEVSLRQALETVEQLLEEEVLT